MVDAKVPGVDRHVLELTRHLITSGWLVDIAYTPAGVDGGFDDELEQLARSVDPVAAGLGEVIRLAPERRAGRLRTVRQLRRLVATQRHDVVHGHGIRGGTWAQLGAAARSTAVIHTPHSLSGQWPDPGSDPRSKLRTLELSLSPFTNHLIHLSEAEATHAHNHGLRPVAWSVVPAWVDPPSDHHSDPWEEIVRIYEQVTPRVGNAAQRSVSSADGSNAPHPAADRERVA